jgi:hypothetical protein
MRQVLLPREGCCASWTELLYKIHRWVKCEFFCLGRFHKKNIEEVRIAIVPLLARCSLQRSISQSKFTTTFSLCLPDVDGLLLTCGLLLSINCGDTRCLLVTSSRSKNL